MGDETVDGSGAWRLVLQESLPQVINSDSCESTCGYFSSYRKVSAYGSTDLRATKMLLQELLGSAYSIVPGLDELLGPLPDRGAVSCQGTRSHHASRCRSTSTNMRSPLINRDPAFRSLYSLDGYSGDTAIDQK